MTLDFTLQPAPFQFAVAIRLRRVGERWVARVAGREDEYTGIAASPRQALAAALAPLGSSVVTALLADIGLIEPSIHVLAAARDAHG